MSSVPIEARHSIPVLFLSEQPPRDQFTTVNSRLARTANASQFHGNSATGNKSDTDRVSAPVHERIREFFGEGFARVTNIDATTESLGASVRRKR